MIARLFLLLTTFSALFATDPVVVGQIEAQIENRLSKNIERVLQDTNKFILTVQAYVDTIATKKAQVPNKKLPGLTSSANLPLSKSNVINRLDVGLVLDKSVSKEKEETIRNIIYRIAKINSVRGDSVVITRDYISKMSLASIAYNYLPWIVLVLVLIALAAGVAYLIYTRNQKNENVVDHESIKKAKQQNKEILNAQLKLTHALIANREQAIELFDKLRDDADNQFMLATIASFLGTKKTKEFMPFYQDEIVEVEHSGIVEVEKFVFMLNQSKDSPSLNKSRPFAFLESLDINQIMYLFQDETPVIKALCISQIKSNAHASAVLNKLEKDEQIEVAIELNKLKNIPIDYYQEIARYLAQKALHLPSYANINVEGEELTLKVLSEMNNQEVNKFFENLKEKDPFLYYQIKEYFFVFEDLFKIHPSVLKTIVREIPKEQLVSALHNESTERQNAVIDNLPDKLASFFKEELEMPSDEAKSKQSKQKVSDFVRKYLKANKISLKEITEEME